MTFKDAYNAKKLTIRLLIVILFISVLPLSATEYLLNEQVTNQEALQTLKSITFWTWD